ncbi:MAG: hypothetical protein ACTSUE_19630 [Promethearchaeota archaeon]
MVHGIIIQSPLFQTLSIGVRACYPTRFIYSREPSTRAGQPLLLVQICYYSFLKTMIK